MHLARLSARIRRNSESGHWSVYPALHRLERKGWIAAEWKASEVGPRLRIYRLTKTGKKQVATERSRWERITTAIAAIMNPAKQESET